MLFDRLRPPGVLAGVETSGAVRHLAVRLVLGVPCSPGERRSRPYPAGTIAAFLRWTKARGADKQPQRRVIDALSALELIERHILNEEEVQRAQGGRGAEGHPGRPQGVRAPAVRGRQGSRPSRQPSRSRIAPAQDPDGSGLVYSGLDDTPHGTLTTLPTTLPTALARSLLAPRRSTVTSNSSHHAVQLRVTLDRRSVLEPSSA